MLINSPRAYHSFFKKNRYRQIYLFTFLRGYRKELQGYHDIKIFRLSLSTKKISEGRIKLEGYLKYFLSTKTFFHPEKISCCELFKRRTIRMKKVTSKNLESAFINCYFWMLKHFNFFY